MRPRTASSRTPAAIRLRVARTLARMPLRERMVVVLLLAERLRPIEVAVTLRLSLRQVERMRALALARLARAAQRPSAPLRRAA